jgi:low affinity Fe/Cu permease
MASTDSTKHRVRDVFNDIAKGCANWMGSPSAFIWSCVAVLAWAASGPYFKYSDTWQLVINTGTTVLTFLAVFLIQNTQNRDAKAIQLKLDELIRAVDGARNHFVDLESLSDDELEKIADEFSHFRTAAKRLVDRRQAKSGEASLADALNVAPHRQ